MENVMTVGANKKGLSLASILLSASMLATGSCGLVSEYILSTVSTYILGNAIEQFSIVIALMMLMMGLANYVQKFMSDENLIEKFIVTEIIIAILGGFSPIAILAVFGIMNNHFTLVLYLLACSIGFLIGLEIPLVLRINEKYSETLTVNLSRIVSFDYFGSFVGAIIWIYLLRKFPLTEISFIVAGVNFMVAVLTFWYFIKMSLVSRKLLILIAILLTSSCLMTGYWHNRDLEINLEQRLYRDRIIFSKTTKYQRIVMTHNIASNEYRFYLNGNLQFSSKDEYIYHELLVHPAMALHKNVHRVLILGGGDGMALREVLKYDSVESVTLVDLDEGMTDLSANNPVLRKLNQDSFRDARLNVLITGSVVSSGRRSVFAETDESTYSDEKLTGKYAQKIAQVDIFNIDADRFIQDVHDNWDLVIIDFPDPNSIELAKLYSKEFFLKLESVMAPNGIFVIQATSPYHAKEAYLCIQRTIGAAGFNTIPFHENVPSFGDWGWFLGWRKNEDASLSMKSRLENLDIRADTKYLTPQIFQRAMTFGKGELKSDFTDISTLMRPVILDLYLRYCWIAE